MRRGVSITAAICISAACAGAGHAVTQQTGLIVFNAITNGSGYNQLYVADLDRGRVRQLTHGRAGGWDPSWSPDGSQIAFDWVSDGPCNSPACSRIWLIRADGSRRRPFTPANLRCEGAAWSPRGDRIAYVQWQPYGNGGNRASIYVRTIDGAEVHRLTFAKAFDAAPVWSPDGLQIEFSREGKGSSGNWIMNADGSNQHRLAHGNPDTAIVSWSPDGRRFTGSRNYGVYGNRYLSVTLNTDGSGERLLLRGGFGPVWSPDGRYVAFLPEEEVVVGQGSVSVVRADGTGRRKLFSGNFTEPRNLDWRSQK